MKAIVVRYTTKDGSSEENESLIKSVFRELEAKSPDGIRYAVLKLADGSFVHLAVTEAADAPNPLRELAAFRAFQSGIAARCVDPPKAADATIVGNYRVFG
jgi:sulfite reductase alpha subunit-like flavoprotein